MTVMVSMLRRHGATMVERHGRPVAAHFGSATAEAAVCRGRVGLAERSDRATLEVRGTRAGVDAALAALDGLRERAWSTRVSRGRALVRCEGAAQDACISAMQPADAESILDVSPEYAAIALVGPRAADALEAAAIDEDTEPVVVLHEGEGTIELLVPQSYGPALWHRLLEAGRPLGIACVGLDALEHLAVSDHVSGGRRTELPAVSGG
jgi:glycine cleavage system aminomethyltransferase T